MSVAEEVPSDFELIAVESSIERQRANFSREKELSNVLRQMRANSIKELHEVLGSKANEYFAFRQKMRDRSRTMRSLYTPTPEGEKIRTEFEKKSIAEVREFLNSIEINPTDIKNIQEKYIAQSQSAIEKAMDITKVSYSDVTFKEEPKLSSNPWTFKRPPYDGDWGGAIQNGTNREPWWRFARTSQSRLTGTISCRSENGVIGEASDSDFSWTEALSEILVWFQMPSVGLLEAWISLQCIETPNYGSLHDEWGVSDARIRQLSRPYLEVLSPREGRASYGLLLDYQRRGDVGSWSNTAACPGCVLHTHLYSLQSYPAGQWVLLAIGIHDFNWFWVNDMNCMSDMNNRWFVRQVALNSSGES